MATAVTTTDDGPEPVGEVLAAYLRAAEAGQAPDQQELLARHPELAPELEAFFAGRDRFDRLAAPLRHFVRTSRVEALLPAATGRAFGDYELLEEIGRGGMGVVYKARQQSLNRLVAIKVVRVDPLAAEAEPKRFRNEAETVAVLDHPHIVPVYEVGERDGYLYFTAKLIEGGSLDRQLARFGDDGRAAARLVASVARAIHHAHQRGILHRDLKPSNILLDADSQPCVSDFGLATRVEGDSSLTQSGVLVGTPSYMAPEQAAGQRKSITTATDVYGLGAVLYTLLAGRPPFQGAGVLETLAQVKEVEPEPPSHVNRRVDRDLETICLKCLEKEPQRRYASAAALAEDLEHWLAGEPIQARPLGRTARWWRWCRRNRLLAGLTATAVIAVALLVVGLAVGSWLLWRENEAKKLALVQARRVVNEWYVQFAEQWLADTPNMSDVQRRYLHSALEFYQQLTQEKSLEPQERLESATVYRRMADIRSALLDFAGADADYQQAVVLLEGLTAEFPAVLDYRLELARCYRLWSFALSALGQPCAGARARYEEIIAQLALDFPDEPSVQDDLATNLISLGYEWQQSADHFAEAEQAYRRALQLCRHLVAGFPHEPRYRVRLANTVLGWATLLNRAGKASESEEAYREAAALWAEHLTRPAPGPAPGPRNQLGGVLNGWGSLLAATGRSREAEATLRRSLEIREGLQAEYPDDTDLWHAVALSSDSLGGLLRATGRPREAEPVYRRAVDFQQKYVDAWPTDPRCRQELMVMSGNLAWLQANGPAPLRDARKALELIQRALDLRPQYGTYLATLQGMTYYRLGDGAQAITVLRRVAETTEHSTPILHGWVSRAFITKQVAECDEKLSPALCRLFLAMSCRQRGETRPALTWYRQALEKWPAERGVPAFRLQELRGIRDEAEEVLGLKESAPAAPKVAPERPARHDGRPE